MLHCEIYDGKLINFSVVVDGLYTYLSCLVLTLPPVHLLIYMFVIIQRFYLEIESENYISKNPYSLGIGSMWVMKTLVIEKNIKNESRMSQECQKSVLVSRRSTRRRKLPDWV